MAFIDMTGMRFGKLLVLNRAQSRVSPSGNTVTRWHCICDCGNELDVDAYALRCGNTKSCGCHQHCKPIKNIIGNRYGKLTVMSYNSTKNNSTFLNCLCDCGNTVVVPKSNLLNGNTKSCGCLHSYGENIVSELLSKYQLRYKRNYRFRDLVGPKGGQLMFDFAVLYKDRLICLIEYQGEQHYRETEFGQVQREITDKSKSIYCAEHNIPLYYINYNEDINEAILPIVFSCMSMIVSSESSRRCNDYPETEYGTGESPAPEAPCSHENEMKK